MARPKITMEREGILYRWVCATTGSYAKHEMLCTKCDCALDCANRQKANIPCMDWTTPGYWKIDKKSKPKEKK